jgi:hypothetical protein
VRKKKEKSSTVRARREKKRGERERQQLAMAEHKEEESLVESVMDKISDKLHGRGGSSSSSSDSDGERTADLKAKIYRLFGREKPVHSVLGGGKRKPQSLKLFFACRRLCSCERVDPTASGFLLRFF